MKKILLPILLILALAVPVHSASYYGCAGAAIDADSTFCTTPTGSCTGTTAVTAATALAGGNTLFANGCTITIGDGLTINATKLSNKDDGGDMVDGGQFTAVTTGWSTGTTINADIETGGTTGACLAISGTGNVAPQTILIQGNITAGSSSTMHGVHATNSAGKTVVGSSGTPISITGGGNTTAYGYYQSGNGNVTIYGNITGATGNGFQNSGTATTNYIYGSCTGGSASASGSGCVAAGGAVAVTGNIIAGSKGIGVTGTIRWEPDTAKRYVKFGGGGTAIYASAGLGSDTDGTQITAANTAAKVSDDSYFVKKDDGVYTVGTMSATGGGGMSAYGW